MATQEIDFAMNFEDHQQEEADKKLFVVFYREAVQSEFKTLQEGRPIFDDVDMIRIHTPGSRDTVVGIAHHGYQQRFPRQWAQYKQNMEQTQSGTPLSAVPWLTASQVAELATFNIKSVEQLAGMPDNVAGRFMNHHALKQQAAAFLEAAKGAAPLLKMQAELASRDEQIAEMQKTIAAMQAKMAADDAAKKVAKAT
jgi:hypothetical protein